MKRIILTSLFLLWSVNVFAAPSNTMSLKSAVSLTTISSSDYNSNNSNVVSNYNSHTHTDITQLGTVTSGGWAASVITPQYGGTGQDFSSVASGATIYANGTGTFASLVKGTLGSLYYLNTATGNVAWLTPGTTGQILKSNGTGANPSWITAGKVVQVVNTMPATSTTGTTNMPCDNSIPTNSEGDQYMTLAITPTSASNYLRVDVVFMGAISTSDFMQAAIYQDTGAAIAVASEYAINDQTHTLTFSYYGLAGTIAATTFKVRAGGTNGYTLTFNGKVGSQLFNGTACSSITITEIQA